MILSTPRLRLRPWRESDLAPFAALNADPRVMEHFPRLQTCEESDESARRIQAAIESQGWGFWALEVIGGAPFIGFTGLAELALPEIVSYTALGNARSIAVMQRLGMRRDIEFEHPLIAPESPVRRHVLYRLSR